MDEHTKESARSNKSVIEYAEREELNERPATYIYPNYIEPLYVVELDDLTVDTFAVLCKKDEKKVFTWKGFEFFEEDQLVSLRVTLEFG